MKMNVTGIVAEYNPFHNGHAYQIREARKLTDCDYCIAVISGDFVQRGEVSVFSKYLRTKMALLSGKDPWKRVCCVFRKIKRRSAKWSFLASGKSLCLKCRIVLS